MVELHQERLRAQFHDRLAAASAADKPFVKWYVVIYDQLIAIATAVPDSAPVLVRMRRELPTAGVSKQEVLSYAPFYLEHTMTIFWPRTPPSICKI